MISQFRLNHILNFFRFFEENPASPLDLILRNYLRDNTAIGSKDRKIISDVIYDIIRYKGLYDAAIEKKLPETEAFFDPKSKLSQMEKRLELSIHADKMALRSNPILEIFEKLSLPKTFYDTLKKSYTESFKCNM